MGCASFVKFISVNLYFCEILALEIKHPWYVILIDKDGAIMQMILMQAASDFTSQTMSRISMSVEPTDSIGSCDLVVEAIVENIAIKQQLFKQLDEAAPS